MVISNGLEVLNSDPVKNVAFSIHMYAEWKANGGRNVGNALWDIQQKGLTVIVGEFAQSHPDGCQWVDIDCWEIMRQCKWKSVGYLGWSWLGNGRGDCNTDLAPLNIVKGIFFNYSVEIMLNLILQVDFCKLRRCFKFILLETK